MCGAFGFTGGFGKNENVGYERFSIVNRLPDVHPRFNARPEQQLPIVISHSPNSLVLMRWGFPVPWSSRPLINAKAETVDTLASFADSFRFRRCLVVAQFFYEWDKKVSPSQPYLFRLKSNALFALAGIYKEFPDRTTGKPVLRFVILTTAANSVVSPVHPDRMGAILRREHETTWLNPDIVEPEKLKPLLTPYPAHDMESYPVGRAVGKNRNDYPELIKPLEQETMKVLSL